MRARVRWPQANLFAGSVFSGLRFGDFALAQPVAFAVHLEDMDVVGYRCFLSRDLSSSNIWLTGGMNGSGFGRAGGPFLRYPGGTACFRIFDTVLRSIPKCRAAALLLIPSTWHARRTRLYSSTEYISPPSARLLQASEWRSFTPRQSDHPTDSV